MEVSRESDAETWEDEPVYSDSIIRTIEKEFEETLNEIENYKISKLTDYDSINNPALKYLEEKIFVILLNILEAALFKAIDTNSLTHHKTPFTPMDFIAEQLWNLNPQHPERQKNWINIFDMDWAQQILQKKPRPYFPFSWIWSKDYAALKIQSYMRGYWVRRRPVIQEMRQFWKALREDEKVETELKSLRSNTCECYSKEDKCTTIVFKQ